MITKKVNRYYCEFCKKSSCNSSHIKKHEASCTANPNRVCNVCKTYLEQEQPDMAALMALIPNGLPDYWGEEECGLVFSKEVMDSTIMALREASGDCPACILAALRQTGVAPYFDGGFKFVEELAKLREGWRDAEANAAWEREHWQPWDVSVPGIFTA